MPCNADKLSEQPWLKSTVATNGSVNEKVELSICPSLAAKMYLPGNDYKDNKQKRNADLTKPTEVFDHCGFHVSFDNAGVEIKDNGEEGETLDYFPKDWYADATAFFNSNNFKNEVM